MKHLYFILGSIVVFMGDLALQWFVPGFSWLMPVWLIVCALLSRRLSMDITYFIGVALLYDIVSGLPLGLTTISYILVLTIISFSSRWVAINRNSFISLIIPTYLMTVVFVGITFFGYALGTI